MGDKHIGKRIARLLENTTDGVLSRAENKGGHPAAIRNKVADEKARVRQMGQESLERAVELEKALRSKDPDDPGFEMLERQVVELVETSEKLKAAIAEAQARGDELKVRDLTQKHDRIADAVESVLPLYDRKRDEVENLQAAAQQAQADYEERQRYCREFEKQATQLLTQMERDKRAVARGKRDRALDPVSDINDRRFEKALDAAEELRATATVLSDPTNEVLRPDRRALGEDSATRALREAKDSMRALDAGSSDAGDRVDSAVEQFLRGRGGKSTPRALEAADQPAAEVAEPVVETTGKKTKATRGAGKKSARQAPAADDKVVE